jgi:predicted nucleic acid-binding Zn ribbon protein
MRRRFPSNRDKWWRSFLDPLADEIRRELARFGPQAGMAELLERWPESVGPAIARNAWPARIGRDGTVHVNTADSVWAFELGQRATEIAARMGVPRVRFAPGPLPSADAEETPRPTATPSAADEERAALIAAAIEDENLRETVKKAVALGLSRAPADRPF